MRPIYIFCESYVQLENTLFVIEQNLDRSPITVIVDRKPDLLKLFKFLKKKKYGPRIDIIYLARFQESQNGLRWVNFVKDIIGEKRHLAELYRKYFKEIENATIYFFCRLFTPYTFYMLKRLIKRNEVRYIYPVEYDELEMRKVRGKGVKVLARKARLKILFGRGLTLTEIPHVMRFPYIKDSFMKNINRCIMKDERNRLMKDFSLANLSLFPNENYKVVFYDSGIDEYLGDVESYKKVLEEIFGIVMEYYDKEQIYIKYHPDEHSMDLSSYGEVVPSFIPGELLHKKDAILLSIMSTCIYNVQAGYAVSLINLFEYKSKEVRDNLKNLFLKRANKDNVLLPDTMGDFRIIISEIKMNG